MDLMDMDSLALELGNSVHHLFRDVAVVQVQADIQVNIGRAASARFMSQMIRTLQF
jgi:hypothetical protein